MADDELKILEWLLRMLLPCVLFWISFGPKVRIPWFSSGHSYTVAELLQHRRAKGVRGSPVPECLASLTLVNEESAPALFQQEKEKASKGGNREDRRGERG